METVLMMRLDKFLADMGGGTRQEVKRIIRQGRVRVDETAVSKPEYKVDETSQRVTLDGREISYCRYEYYMLNKPAGVVSATEDACKTVIELIEGRKRKDLFPVGRLDKDTEGLLLLTNDGALAHRLLSPGRHVQKKYDVRTDLPLGAKEAKLLEEGVEIGEKEPTRPAVLERIGDREFFLTITEGKFHQVKRMFGAVGLKVLSLKRVSMGSLLLDKNLPPGQVRELSKEEVLTLCSQI